MSDPGTAPPATPELSVRAWNALVRIDFIKAEEVWRIGVSELVERAEARPDFERDLWRSHGVGRVTVGEITLCILPVLRRKREAAALPASLPAPPAVTRGELAAAVDRATRLVEYIESRYPDPVPTVLVSAEDGIAIRRLLAALSATPTPGEGTP